MIYYEREGTGYPLILLHGFTGSSIDWKPHREVFASHFDVIVVDLPGHGRTKSSADKFSMSDVAAELIILLAELKLNVVNLLGYSMGGRLALYIAVHYPHLINKLVLESASPGLKTEEERLLRQKSDEQLACRIEQQGVQSFVDYWETISMWESQKNLPDNIRTDLRTQRLQNSAAGLASSLRGMGTGQQPSLWNNLATMSRPTKLIVGALDRKFTDIAIEMQQHLPTSELTFVSHAGHNIHLEQPDTFNDMVIKFLT